MITRVIERERQEKQVQKMMRIGWIMASFLKLFDFKCRQDIQRQWIRESTSAWTAGVLKESRDALEVCCYLEGLARVCLEKRG